MPSAFTAGRPVGPTKQEATLSATQLPFLLMKSPLLTVLLFASVYVPSVSIT